MHGSLKKHCQQDVNLSLFNCKQTKIKFYKYKKDKSYTLKNKQYTLIYLRDN